jgi:DNA modification methylase
MKFKVIEGDCLEQITELPADHFQLVIADPPYGKVVSDQWDNTDPFQLALISQIKRVMTNEASLYVWCGIGEKSSSLLRFIERLDTELIFKDLITWKKQRGVGMRKGWLYTREELLWYVKTKNFFWNANNQYSDELRVNSKGVATKGFYGRETKSSFKRFTNVWVDIAEESMDTSKLKIHSTPKPLVALERIVKSHTLKGDNVLDLFSGTGGVAVVCKKLKRNCVSIEIDPELVSYIKKRLTNNVG